MFSRMFGRSKGPEKESSSQHSHLSELSSPEQQQHEQHNNTVPDQYKQQQRQEHIQDPREHSHIEEFAASSAAVDETPVVEDIANRTAKLTFPKSRRGAPPSEDELLRALGADVAAQVEKVGFKDKYAAVVFRSAAHAERFVDRWRDFFPPDYKCRLVGSPQYPHATDGAHILGEPVSVSGGGAGAEPAVEEEQVALQEHLAIKSQGHAPSLPEQRVCMSSGSVDVQGDETVRERAALTDIPSQQSADDGRPGKPSKPVWKAAVVVARRSSSQAEAAETLVPSVRLEPTRAEPEPEIAGWSPQLAHSSQRSRDEAAYEPPASVRRSIHFEEEEEETGIIGAAVADKQHGQEQQSPVVGVREEDDVIRRLSRALLKDLPPPSTRLAGTSRRYAEVDSSEAVGVGAGGGERLREGLAVQREDEDLPNMGTATLPEHSSPTPQSRAERPPMSSPSVWLRRSGGEDPVTPERVGPEEGGGARGAVGEAAERDELLARLALLEVEAQMRRAERRELDRDVRRSEARWAAEITALTVRAAGLERELRESEDACRRLRMELAERDAEVAALTAAQEDADLAQETVSARAEREALGTVLAQSKLVAILDRQRTSTESLTQALRAELETLRDAHRVACADALEWKLRALNDQQTPATAAALEVGTGESRAEGEEDAPPGSAVREVAREELDSYLRTRDTSALSASSKDPTSVSAASSGGKRVQFSSSGRSPRRPPPPLSLSESLVRDLEYTQQRLDLIQSRAASNLSFTRAGTSTGRSAVAVGNGRLPDALSAPLRSYSSQYGSSPLYGVARSRTPKSDGLKEWFNANTSRKYSLAHD